ncbi:phosphoglyceromutase [Solitalea sp. MAHUQ-68]|uniref:Phosphoglyceromutase n=1 Tax=Solitalea agri TaxID=2953739 RepID=A0A9X2JET3_9SPHI|nr:phosphoglyceromutase [Solitalea agri]MCO4294265.1 phosphoglyceromutase [Solitalea agri]
MKKLPLLIVCLFTFCSFAQTKPKTKNVILITLDGYRWQELFRGADSSLINNKEFTQDAKGITKEFWAETAQERRQMLMPFIWGTIAKQGQIYGNRDLNNKVDVTNPYWFSYPGYSELLCGYADTAVNSNNKKNNPNVTVLEFLNNKPEFKGKVAAFGSWEVFPYIINRDRSKIPVNAGYEKVEGSNLSASTELLNVMQTQVPDPFGAERLDVFTHYLAKEYMIQHHPRVLFIGHGETDEWAHEGHYDFYLRSANYIDQYLADLWNFIQHDSFYKDQTTLIITADHGRGEAKDGNWRHHSKKIEGANQIWLAAIGPDVLSTGEIKSDGQLFQNQVAATLAHLLGIEFKSTQSTGNPITSLTK